MTVASGLVHEEFHGRDFARRGGTFEMARVMETEDGGTRGEGPDS